MAVGEETCEVQLLLEILPEAEREQEKYPGCSFLLQSSQTLASSGTGAYIPSLPRTHSRLGRGQPYARGVPKSLPQAAAQVPHRQAETGGPWP